MKLAEQVLNKNEAKDPFLEINQLIEKSKKELDKAERLLRDAEKIVAKNKTEKWAKKLSVVEKFADKMFDLDDKMSDLTLWMEESEF